MQHARLGWAHLSTVRDPAALAWLGDALPGMLSGTVPAEIFDIGSEPGFLLETEGLGCLSRASRREVFTATMRDVVLPGFAACGVDVTRARGWLVGQGVASSPQR